MSLFDKTNQNVTAFRNAAPFVPATMGESLTSAYDVVSKTETSFAFESMRYDMFERYRDQIEELTGDRLYNPLDRISPMIEAEAGLGPEPHMDEWFDQISQLRTKFPAIPQITHEKLMADIKAERQKYRDQRAEVASRETSFGNSVAGFVGGAGAVLTDPIVLGSMAIGAPAATSVLRAIAIEAAIGAGSEVVVQAAVQAARERLGEGRDFEQAATNILLAGVGGGLLAGVIRGGISGTKALLRRTRELPADARTPEVRAAERYLARKVEMEDHNPFGPSVAGQIEHARRLDQAMLNLVRPTRQLLQDGTAIGRVLPVDDAPEILPIRPSENLDQYVNRVRLENRELFAELDTANARISEADIRVNQITDELAEIPKGDAVGAGKLAKARKIVAESTDPRKVARAERTVAKLEQSEEIGNALRRQVLTEERAALQGELKDLSKQAKTLQRDVKKAVKKTKRRSVPTAAPTIAAIEASGLDATAARFSRFMAELGEEAANRTDSLAPLAADVPQRFPVRDVLDIEPDFEKVVKDEARIDAELQRAVDEDPDKLYIVEDPNTGAIRELTATQLLDDLAEDQKLLDEFQKCITEVLP